jgi:hypothetical protein
MRFITGYYLQVNTLIAKFSLNLIIALPKKIEWEAAYQALATPTPVFVAEAFRNYV